MTLYECLLIANNCYKCGYPMKPSGIVVHSTGANNPTLKRAVQPLPGQTIGVSENWETLRNKIGTNTYGNHWNVPLVDGYRECCVHAFIGQMADGSIATIQTLPYNMQCWGCGAGPNGSNNKTHIQFEVCEDGLSNADYFNKVMTESIEYCADLCRQFDINVDNIVSHHESYVMGKGSNHGDIDHWLKRFGWNMDIYRQKVKEKIEEADAMTQEEKIAFQKLQSKVNNLENSISNIAASIDKTAKAIGDLATALHTNTKELEKVREKYVTLNDVPTWAKPTIQKLMNQGILNGGNDGRLNLTQDLVRILFILDQAKVFDKSKEYNTIDEVPDWSKSTIKKLIEKEVIQGTGEDKLGLNLDLIRTFVLLDRAEIFDK